MGRLRFFRILLPAILVPFVVLLVLELRPRATPVGEEIDTTGVRTSADGVRHTALEGESPKFEVEVREYRVLEDGQEQARGVDWLEIFREGASSLTGKAGTMRVVGEAPERLVYVEDGLDLSDEEAGLSLRLPTLVIDEARDVARTEGEVAFSAPGYDGTASELTYGLSGQPPVFTGIAVRSTDGATLEAGHARLVDGSDEIVLGGSVRATRGLSWFEAPDARVSRVDGRVREVYAHGGVRGAEAPAGQAAPAARAARDDAPEAEAATFDSETLRVTWDDEGSFAEALWEHATRFTFGVRTLRSETARLTHPEGDAEGWRIEAEGDVFAQGIVADEASSLSCALLHAEFDADGEIRSGFAEGGVRFEGGDGVGFATADTAHIVPDHDASATDGDAADLRVELAAVAGRKARLASQERRVAGDRIVTWPGTERLEAEGRVEASLLPSSDPSDGAGPGIFRSGTAVHFVAHRMSTSEDGRYLDFTGDVRAWQGERNLSADRVRYDRTTGRITAEGDVATRVPLVEGTGVSVADYVQVGAESLVYDDRARTLLYEGGVRARQVDGSIDAERLELTLDDAGAVVRMVAETDVAVEFRAPGDDGRTIPLTGGGDRVVYAPEESVVTLFGTREPAWARRPGSGGGVTRGRVLRYGLDDDTITIEAGERDRGSIVTGADDRRPE